MISLTSVFGKDAAIVRDTNFQLLLLANLLGPMGSGVVSPILDSLTGPLGVSAADIGLMMSAFSAPAIVMIPLAGALADRYGRKPPLVAGLALFGVGGVAMAFTTDFRAILALRLLQGAGFAGIVPVIITSIGDLYAGSTEATAQGIRFTSSGLSQTAFPLLAGALVALAWEYPFYLYAVALPIAALVLVFFEEPSDPDPATDGGDDAGSGFAALWELLRYRHVSAMVIARALPVVVWIGFMTYNSIVVVKLLDGTPTEAGFLVALGSFSMAVAASQAGRITAAFSRRLYPLLATNLALGIGFAGLMVAPTLPAAYLSIVLAGSGFGVTLSLYRSIVTGLAPAAARGSLVSVAEAFSRLTATLTPIVMGASIALAAPALGFAPALRITGLGIAAVGGLGGVVCLLVVAASPLPPASPDEARSVG